MLLTSILCLVFVSSVLANFGSSGQQGILNAHNNLRSSIALGNYVVKGARKATATNMLQMKWDSGLEQSAQNYANRCPTGHSGTNGVGENLYWYWSSNVGDLNQYGAMASAAWAKEFQDKGWPTNYFDNNLFNTGIGHATQMAWANSGKIGCGVSQCQDGSWQKVTVVCQYKPPGNYLGQYIYNSGKTCSQCPSGTQCVQNSGLCA
ncbi:unnamed protein product [Caenorhabditis auriculariae]|uniref:SCP domain-containing protein n=1 Tax=Caenorhabditis auriculariae TaxID=2777116 RepID=A0A8S1HLB5_9PELO|nr:unnamed protein product [Caenorhabditis auriculariae]